MLINFQIKKLQSRITDTIFIFQYSDFGNNSNLQYLHGIQYVLGYVAHRLPDYLQPKTEINLNFTSFLMVLGYVIFTFILVPRFFTESLLRYRHIFTFNTRVTKIISETERRNPEAQNLVEKYYSVVWNNWNGITAIPDVVNNLPMHLILSLKQDLTWAVFYHSPTLRNTSLPYKRWLCQYINLEYKLAGERFFTGVHCYTNLYYIKSGVVQFFSSDDATSAILSVTDGTIFGDVSSIVPPLKRKVMVRCQTYCEVFVISRAKILVSLHKFPEDRRHILRLVKQRMKHARDLYACKQDDKSKDVVEDENIEWIKRRWWEISKSITHRRRVKKESKYELLPEEMRKNHCPKYIGQLVLCNENQLKKRSMFVNDGFPWILGDRSIFFRFWTYIVWLTVCIVILVFPPSIVRAMKQEAYWFSFVVNCVDLIFAVDIVVLLSTAVQGQENTPRSFSSIISYRFRNVNFILDLLATCLLDILIKAAGGSEYVHIFMFNRLIKMHVLFSDRQYIQWERTNKPERTVLKKIALWHILFLYVCGYILYVIASIIPDMTLEYYFNDHCLISNTTGCAFHGYGILSLTSGYFYRMFYYIGVAYQKTAIDSMFEACFVVALFILSLYTRSAYLGALYFKYRNRTIYQHLVRHITQYYIKQEIHPDLMIRLQRYLYCHWKYFSGYNILESNPMKNETFIIFWKCHGEVAEKIISESTLFQGADPALVRDLAQKSKLLLLPRNAVILLFGVQMFRLNWLLKVSTVRLIMSYI